MIPGLPKGMKVQRLIAHHNPAADFDEPEYEYIAELEPIPEGEQLSETERAWSAHIDEIRGVSPNVDLLIDNEDSVETLRAICQSEIFQLRSKLSDTERKARAFDWEINNPQSVKFLRGLWRYWDEETEQYQPADSKLEACEAAMKETE